MEPPGKLIMCFLQFVGHRGLCHMPEASEGREAVVASILVCGKGQEKQLRLTLHSKDLSQPRIDQGFPEPHVGHRREPAGFLKPHLGQPVRGERRWGS